MNAKGVTVKGSITLKVLMANFALMSFGETESDREANLIKAGGRRRICA